MRRTSTNSAFAFRERAAPINRRAGAQRGVALVVALLLAGAIAIFLGSYLVLSMSSLRGAKRTFDGYAALNVAEAGAEEAVWAFNRSANGDTSAWSSWNRNNGAAWRVFSNYDFGDNTSGAVKVYIPHTDVSGDSLVVTQASVAVPNGMPVEKMLEVTLRRRSLFANGLVARQAVSFSGNNATVDSWNSDPDNTPSTPPVPYSAAVRTDHGSVATTAVVNSAVNINQANVWGYVATGGGQPQVGANGTVRGLNTPPGVAVDPNRISTDFAASLPNVTAPTDGIYLSSLGSTLGIPGMKTRWRAPAIVLSGTNSLTINGDVTLILLAGPGTTSVSLTGSSSLNLAANSSLTLYAEGDLKIAGNGIANANVQPATLQIYGTNTTDSGQSVDIAGNGALTCVFYGPNADLKLNGNGDIMGAFIGRNITITGNAAFHFDEALGMLGNAEYGMVKWRELTGVADRAPYSGYFTGW